MYVLVFLLLLIIPVHASAADYLAGFGISYPLEVKHGHTTTAKAGVVDLTQYPWTNSWGAIGLRETVWFFPDLDNGLAGGIGPAGELRYFPLHPFDDWMFFLTASGSVGSSNLNGRCPEVTGHIQFGGQAGIGMELGERVRMELRYQHLSNGHTSLPNIGLDMLTPMISLRF